MLSPVISVLLSHFGNLLQQTWEMYTPIKLNTSKVAHLKEYRTPRNCLRSSKLSLQLLISRELKKALDKASELILTTSPWGYIA